MHTRMFITLAAPQGSKSAGVRCSVYERLMADDSFCGDAGRFGSPLCDWFVIGGRWSGTLAETAIGPSHRAAVRTRFPELAAHFWPDAFARKNAAQLDAIWNAHNGKGPSPYTRSGYEQLGFDDDATVLTQTLYDALLAEHEGQTTNSVYADLDDEPLSPEFVGRKWIVVIDYHS